MHATVHVCAPSCTATWCGNVCVCMNDVYVCGVCNVLTYAYTHLRLRTCRTHTHTYIYMFTYMYIDIVQNIEPFDAALRTHIHTYIDTCIHTTHLLTRVILQTYIHTHSSQAHQINQCDSLDKNEHIHTYNLRVVLQTYIHTYNSHTYSPNHSVLFSGASGSSSAAVSLIGFP